MNLFSTTFACLYILFLSEVKTVSVCVYLDYWHFHNFSVLFFKPLHQYRSLTHTHTVRYKHRHTHTHELSNLTSPLMAEGLVSSSGSSLRKDVATACRASSGQALNQSIVQQVTSEGNCLSRARNTSPMGLGRRGIKWRWVIRAKGWTWTLWAKFYTITNLMQSTVWMLLRTLLM